MSKFKLYIYQRNISLRFENDYVIYITVGCIVNFLKRMFFFPPEHLSFIYYLYVDILCR